MKIYIGGSDSVLSLDTWTMNKLDSMMHKGYQILVGDSTMTDRLIQSYLLVCKYRNVLVYCKERPKINIGDFCEVMCMHDNANKVHMAIDCDYALMIGNDISEYKIEITNVNHCGKCCACHMPSTDNCVVVKPSEEVSAA